MTVVDHLVMAVPNLEEAIDDVGALLGIRPEHGGAHEGLGTHNALLSFGSCYLEIVAPDPAQPDAPSPRPFNVESYDSPTLVTFAVRPDRGSTIDEVISTARAAGYDPGDPISMHRIRPDGGRLDWQLTLPDPLGSNLVPFVIDWGATVSPSDSAPRGVSLESFVIGAPSSDRSTRSALDALAVRAALDDAESPNLFARLNGPAGTMELRS